MFTKQVADKIRFIRQKRKLSKASLASKLQLNYRTFQEIELGKRPILAEQLFIIAQTVEAPINYFFDQNPSKTKITQTEQIINIKQHNQLIEAYQAIKDPKTRKYLIQLLISLSDFAEN